MLNKEELVSQIQRFTASSISMVQLLQDVVSASTLSKDSKAVARFLSSGNQFVDNLRTRDNSLDYTRFIKKAFGVLRERDRCQYIIDKNHQLFNIRDIDNKIVTIIPGIDLRVGYGLLDADQKTQFWQYLYLFCSSVFQMIRTSNPTKFEKNQYLDDCLNTIELELAKTGVVFNKQIFNPFIGLNAGNESKETYGLTDMFTGDELPKEHSVSIDSVLSMLGVDKMFDEKKLNEELKNIGEEQINIATDQIANLLGAGDNQEVREVCNTLIQDIVLNFKENGINNIGETLRRVAENAKNNIEIDKMRKTADSMKYFMENNQEKMRNMKDADGNPIGEQLMNSMTLPMNMMNMLKGMSFNTDTS